MTKHDVTQAVSGIKQLLGEDEAFLREGLRGYLQEVLESEMTAQLGASKGERVATRVGYRSGYYERSLVTRVGALELRVPQDRNGCFSTSVFERYQRSEKALVAALVEMYVQGGGLDPQGEAGHGRAVRPQFLGLDDLEPGAAS